jgi:SAM-dependent methyltransferase
MRRFLRKSSVGSEPLLMAMSAVRMGERLLQIGIDDTMQLGALAAKVGISGHAAIAVFDERSADRARAAVANAATLADIVVTREGALPLDAESFDVGIVNSVGGLLVALDPAVRARLLAELFRVMRTGGRVITVEPGTPSGLRALFAPAPKVDEEYERSGGTVSALQSAGFRPVRLLADRDGLRFTEGLKT